MQFARLTPFLIVVLIDYVYSGSRMLAKAASGNTQYSLSDRLSARLSLDQSGNVIGRQGHLPFGEEFGESGTQEKHHFTSYERNAENGSDYAVNRNYSANLGRFQQADPYKASGYIVDPQSWNRYAYAQSEPVNRLDPIGLDFIGGWIGIGNAVYNASDGPPIHLYGWDYYPPGGAGGDGKHGPLVDTGDDSGGASGESIWNLISQFWNNLTKCEKLVALENLPGVLVAHEAAGTATQVELGLRGGKDGDDDYPNAVKHCVWSCIMTVRLDFAAAKAFGDAHEQDPKSHCQTYTDVHSLMDQHNNDVGRTIGYNLGFSGSAEECTRRCESSSDLQKQP